MLLPPSSLCLSPTKRWTSSPCVQRKCWAVTHPRAVGQLDLASGGYLQVLAITPSSVAMYAGGLGSFAGNFEVDSDAPGAPSSRNVLVAKVDNSSVSCPTTSCSVTDCPFSYTCSCSGTLTQGTNVTSNYYCVASYSQTVSSSDDSNNGLWALFPLFALPLVGIARSDPHEDGCQACSRPSRFGQGARSSVPTVSYSGDLHSPKVVPNCLGGVPGGDACFVHCWHGDDLRTCYLPHHHSLLRLSWWSECNGHQVISSATAFSHIAFRNAGTNTDAAAQPPWYFVDL